MDRRNFLKSTTVASLLPLAACSNKIKDTTEISCFIFSDAHIGFSGIDQPSLETQAAMIQVIKQKFPNCDLVFDTGDVHHATIYNEERRLAREFWLQQMAGQFFESFFHYIPGNHELDRGRYDAEVTAGELGSFNFRPYYSFDYKGIHFVSLPQLLDTIYITKESLNWLKQDLVFNASKTTLIFSHNSLRGTTFNNGETGYRETVNSQDVMDIIDSHKQVLGWFHGHNHQYEIVKNHGRLYVSNGRIGGFNPPKHWGDFGQDHLGGIHLRINSKGLEVRAFSATEGKFMDQLGFPKLSNFIKTDTSFDPNGKVNYYFGHGRLVNGVPHQLNNHYLSTKSTEVFVTSNNTSQFNENVAFENPSKLYFAGRETNRIMGFRVSPKNTQYETNKTGLEIKLNKIAYVHVPDWRLNKANYMARSGYYRCAPGQALKLNIDCKQLNGTEKIYYQYSLYSRSHELIYKQEYSQIKLINGRSETLIQTPKKLSKNLNSDKLYVVFILKILGQNEGFVLQKIELNQVASINDKDKGYVNEIQVNKKSLKFNSVGHLRVDVNTLFQNGTANIKLQNSKDTQTVYFQIPDVKWLIRNAVASFKNNTIIIHRLRSNFQTNQEIILTPVNCIESYIAKTHYMTECELTIEQKIIKIRTNDFNPKAAVMLKTKSQVKSITGGNIIKSAGVGIHWIALESSVLEIHLE